MNKHPHRIVADAAGVEAVDQVQQQNSTASPTPSQSVNDLACHFLRLILPEEGPYVAFIVEKDGVRKRIVFAGDTSELWEIIKAADTAGHTAYHACAGYKEARYDPRGTPPAQRRYGRTKRNVRGAKSCLFRQTSG
jgi:hypothetical protein